MSARTLAIVLIVAAACVSGTIAMHGHGHRLLAKWLPALHGGR